MREGAVADRTQAAAAAAAVDGCRAGDGDQAARQPLRAFPGRARGRPRRRGRRPAARGADGPRGTRGQASAAADRGGPVGRGRRSHGGGADHVRSGLRAPADHVQDDRLPHQRVPRPRGRRSLRAGGGEPDDRLSRGLALHARAGPAAPRARRNPPGLGPGPHKLPRDDPVRPHPARARAAFAVAGDAGCSSGLDSSSG